MSSFTPEQLLELEQLIALKLERILDARELSEAQKETLASFVHTQPSIQYLLKRVETLSTELETTREQFLALVKAGTPNKHVEDLQQLGVGPTVSALNVLTSVCEGVYRYIDSTANNGHAARKNDAGELVVDLGHRELKDYLPTTWGPPATLFYIIKKHYSRRYVRKISQVDKEFMNWDVRLRAPAPPYSLVVRTHNSVDT